MTIKLNTATGGGSVSLSAPNSTTSNLDVELTLPVDDGAANTFLKSDGAGTLSWASASSDSITEGNTSAEVVDTGSDGHFKVVTEGTEALRVDSSQRVGIGTASPGSFNADFNNLVVGSGSGSEGIVVYSGTASNASIVFHDTADVSLSGMIRYDHSSNAMSFWTNGVNERARITSAGRVGIGTTSPDYTVDINGELGITEGQPITWHNGSGSLSGQIFCTSGDEMVFRNTSVGLERMRINASGQTLIGKTSETLSTPGWAIDGGSFIGRGQLTCGSAGSPILRLNHTGATSTEYVVESFKNGTQVGSISVTASATAYNTSSDYRLKENVSAVTDGITRLQQLKPSRFNFIADPGHTVDGFIAHEAQAVVPECVTGTHNEVEVWKEGEELPDGVSVGDNKLDEDGNTIPVYQGIDQAKLIPLLTAALQEALAKIETLETANASLEARLTALEGGAS